MILDISWEELANRAALEAWTAAMLGLWEAGLWVLRLALGMIDALVVPDLSADGPGRAVYGVAFWLAGALVTVLLLVQLGVAVLRRDGAALATALMGVSKFLVVWAGWLAYGAAVVAACGGLTRALLQELLHVGSWAAWQPFADLDAEDVTDATVATVLGLMGLLLWLAAIGHLVVMITRAGALLVLAAVTPAAAAGLVGEAGQAWFWKSLRWFHAAAFTPVLMVLMLGVGVQLTTGVVTGQSGPAAAIGTALPGVLLILVSCVSPLALFRLLAFVDPATPAGASVREAWAAGTGLTGGLRSLGGGGSDEGSVVAAGGSSAGEAAASDATQRRAETAATELLGMAGGPAGVAAAAGIQAVQAVGSVTEAASANLAAVAGADRSDDQPTPTTGPGPGPAEPTAVDASGTGPQPRPVAATGSLSERSGVSDSAPGLDGGAADAGFTDAAAVATRVPVVPV